MQAYKGAALFMLTAIACATADAATRYDVQVLDRSYDVVDVNAAGDAVLTWGAQAYLYQKGSLTSLPTGFKPLDLNNVGTVLGEGNQLYQNGQVTTLTLPDKHQLQLINDNGAGVGVKTQWVGEFGNGSTLDTAFLYRNGQLEYMTNPTPHSSNQQFNDFLIAFQGFNNQGQFTGTRLVGTYVQSNEYVFTGAGSQVTQPQIVVAGKGDNSVATGLNESGVAIGYSAKSYDGQPKRLDPVPFIFENGVAKSLSLLPGDNCGLPVAINSSGTVVGISSRCYGSQLVEIAPGSARPFVYDDGTLRDLNDLADLPGQLVDVSGIDDKGRVWGTLYDPATHAWLGTAILTPQVPEPTTAAMVAGGLLLLAGRKKARRG